MDKIERLRKEIAQREAELVDLRAQLAEEEKLSCAEDEKDDGKDRGEWKWPLEEHDYQRYSRQMIVPNFGLQGISLSMHILPLHLLV
jgi:adenylyltransferase/sulfurtransferase